MSMKSVLAAVSSIALLAGIPAVAFATDSEHSLEQVLVESATDSADHAALARYYRAKAAEARAEAERHEKLGKSYLEGKVTQKMQMQKHCKKIAEILEAQAAEYDALANLHDADAKKVAK